MNRRQIVSVVGSTLIVPIAGCSSTDETEREQGSADGNGDSTSNQDELVELLEHEFYEGEREVGIRGQVENISDEELSFVEAEAFFLDSEGVQFAEGFTNVEYLPAGRIWEFETGFLGDEPDRIEDYEIQAAGSIREEDNQTEAIELLEHEFYEGEREVGVRGQIENVSDEELAYVGTSQYYIDSEGIQFGTGFANTEELAAGRVWEFESRFLGDEPERIEDYDIQLEVTREQ